MNKYKNDTANVVYLEFGEDTLCRKYRSLTVRFNSNDAERINRYLTEKKISQSELLRNIIEKNELIYLIKKSSESIAVLNAIKTFSVEDRLYKIIESRAKELNIPTATLVRELILANID